MCDYEHCDSCGCRVNAKAKMVVESLPCDVASANVGESATRQGVLAVSSQRWLIQPIPL